MNKKHVLYVATSLAALAVAAPSWAETTGASNLFLTASVGQAKADLGDLSGWTVDDTDTAYSIGAGYKINENIAIEGGYVKLGTASASVSGTISGTYYGNPISATGTVSASAEVDGYYLGPVFGLLLSDKFEGYAKVGILFWDADLKASATGTLTYAGTTYPVGSTVTGSDDGNDVYYGLGVAYKVTKEMSLGADWTRYDIDGTDVDVFGARLKYSF